MSEGSATPAQRSRSYDREFESYYDSSDRSGKSTGRDADFGTGGMGGLEGETALNHVTDITLFALRVRKLEERDTGHFSEINFGCESKYGRGARRLLSPTRLGFSVSGTRFQLVRGYAEDMMHDPGMYRSALFSPYMPIQI